MIISGALLYILRSLLIFHLTNILFSNFLIFKQHSQVYISEIIYFAFLWKNDDCLKIGSEKISLKDSKKQENRQILLFHNVCWLNEFNTSIYLSLLLIIWYQVRSINARIRLINACWHPTIIADFLLKHPQRLISLKIHSCWYQEKYQLVDILEYSISRQQWSFLLFHNSFVDL